MPRTEPTVEELHKHLRACVFGRPSGDAGAEYDRREDAIHHILDGYGERVRQLEEALKAKNEALCEVIQGLYRAQTTGEVEAVRDYALEALDDEYVPEAWQADKSTREL